MTTQTLTNAPDLRTGFPRSPNASLGGYVILPRIIDKCRALVAGTIGEYKYNCPLDRRFFDYTEVDADAFREQVTAGKSDEELLAWVQENAQPRNMEDIRAWSYQQRWRTPEMESMGFFEEMREKVAPDNFRIQTWFQLLDAEEGRF